MKITNPKIKSNISYKDIYNAVIHILIAIEDEFDYETALNLAIAKCFIEGLTFDNGDTIGNIVDSEELKPIFDRFVSGKAKASQKYRDIESILRTFYFYTSRSNNVDNEVGVGLDGILERFESYENTMKEVLTCLKSLSDSFAAIFNPQTNMSPEEMQTVLNFYKAMGTGEVTQDKIRDAVAEVFLKNIENTEVKMDNVE